MWTRSAQEAVFNDPVIFSQLQKRQICGRIFISAPPFLHGFMTNQYLSVRGEKTR
jgi:hypothetical protein